ncbi:Methyl-CpG-binding domain protein [Quillaja saponaria]|uniref:Methyl-CpG-binding domain protein n=1 Tax=Quillaja saponaria TaxID=32244 RepID=A0AAD7KS93_QUISA|nr:Methyl-CpG-binding domain protein [Quillaja saponaria]
MPSSPQRLPAGWIVQNEVQKSGRKIRVYKNVETGLKVFSKDDVIHHLKVRSTYLEKPQKINKQTNRKSKSNPKQTVQKTIENPEWLPDGWKMELRTRNSGSKVGTRYKCYIETMTGCTFYSKPEVLQYLKTINQRSCCSKKRRGCTDMHYESKVVAAKHTTEDLPPGWKKDVKIRKIRGGIKKDPYYIDPASGYAFRSKKDVLRYLEAGDMSSCAMRPIKWQINDKELRTEKFTGSAPCLVVHPSSAVKMQHSTRRKPFGGKGRSDRSCLKLQEAKSLKIDETVHEMHSLENVITDAPKIKESSDLVTPPAEMKEKNYTANVDKKTSRKKQKDLIVPPRCSRRLAGNEPEQVMNSVTRECDPQVSTRKSRKSGTIIDSGLEKGASQQFSVRFEPKQMLNSVTCERALQVSTRTTRKNRTILDAGLDNEAAQHQSVWNEPEKVVNSVTCEQSFQIPTRQTRNSRTMIDAGFANAASQQPSVVSKMDAHPQSVVLEKRKLLDSGTEKTGDGKTQVISNKSKNKKEHNLPCRASKRLAGFEPEVMPNSIYCERALEYSSKKSKSEAPRVISANVISQQSRACAGTELAHNASTMINTSINGESSSEILKSLEVQDAPHEQMQKLVEEKFDDHKSEPQISFAFHHSWSDPCLEFAMKTLTSPLPVADTVDSGPIITPGTDALGNSSLYERGRGKSNNRHSQEISKKSKNKKELNLPHRASKRLAGHEPELMAKSISSERVLEYATRKPHKDGNTVTGNFTSRASHQLDVGKELELNNLASDSNKSRIFGESSNKSHKSNEEHMILEEQQQQLEAEKLDDKQSGPQLSFPLGDYLSDPCLEFAIKTLTGALPVEEAVDSQPATIPKTEVMQSCLVIEKGRRESSNRHVQNSKKLKKKKELNLPCRSSKRLAGHEPELLHKSISSERALEYVTRKRCTGENTVTGILTDGASQKLDVGEASEFNHLASNNTETRIHGQPSNECGKSYEDHATLDGQPQQLEAEKMDDKKSEPQLSFPFGGSWSDPCLEFAIKTLTGALPLEDAADVVPVMSPENDVLQEKKLVDSVMEKSIKDESQVKSNESNNKKGQNLACQLSQQHLDHRSESQAIFISSKNAIEDCK